jgi:hypothetical protein
MAASLHRLTMRSPTWISCSRAARATGPLSVRVSCRRRFSASALPGIADQQRVLPRLPVAEVSIERVRRHRDGVAGVQAVVGAVPADRLAEVIATCEDAARERPGVLRGRASATPRRAVESRAVRRRAVRTCRRGPSPAPTDGDLPPTPSWSGPRWPRPAVPAGRQNCGQRSARIAASRSGRPQGSERGPAEYPSTETGSPDPAR